MSTDTRKSCTEQELLDAAQRGVERAQALGADQTEDAVGLLHDAFELASAVD